MSQMLQDVYQYYVEMASKEENAALKAHYELQMERISDRIHAKEAK